MDWKEVIKNVDWSPSTGRRDKVPARPPKKGKNPMSRKRKPTGGMTVDTSVPTGKIPDNKCDSWPDCKNNATKYCVVCCMKACDRCYPMFAISRPGSHPSVPYNGGNNRESFVEHCNINPKTGKGEMKKPEPPTNTPSGKKDSKDKYSTGKDW